MAFIAYLYNVVFILIFFEVIWKFIFKGFVFASLAWKPIDMIGRIIGYYLMVSLIVLQTIISIQDSSSRWALFVIAFGGVLTFFIIGGRMAEAKKEIRQTIDHYGVILFGCLVFYDVAMLIPFLASPSPVLWAAAVINWFAIIPIVGWLISLYGARILFRLISSMIFLGGISYFVSFLLILYKKTGICVQSIKRSSHTKLLIVCINQRIDWLRGIGIPRIHPR